MKGKQSREPPPQTWQRGRSKEEVVASEREEQRGGDSETLTKFDGMFERGRSQ